MSADGTSSQTEQDSALPVGPLTNGSFFIGFNTGLATAQINCTKCKVVTQHEGSLIHITESVSTVDDSLAYRNGPEVRMYMCTTCAWVTVKNPKRPTGNDSNETGTPGISAENVQPPI